MSAQTKPEPTDVAVRESSGVGILPPELQQALALRKMRNQVAGQLAAQNWGKSLDLETRRAIADWGQQFRVDVSTEIHVLGGNVYLNSAFYLRQLSELIAAGAVEYAYADHIEDDKRLRAIGPEGEGEYSRRLRERLMHGVPDAAASAVVFRVKLRSMDKEVTGCKWTGGGTKKNDPVGEAFPVETAESRAARRCVRLVTSHVPARSSLDVLRIEDAADVLSDRVKVARASLATSEASMTGLTGRLLNEAPSIATPADGAYGLTEDEPATNDALAAALAFPLPFAQAETAKGVSLADVPTKDLRDALRYAEGTPKFNAFSAAAVTVLESREGTAE